MERGRGAEEPLAVITSFTLLCSIVFEQLDNFDIKAVSGKS